MEHLDKIKAISHIRPGAEFVLRGDVLEWSNTEQAEPTDKEIKDGFIAYQSAQKAEAEAKEAQRQAILDRLGITSEEAKILLGS